ncbi:hypothetical protein ABZ490_14160 [Streptomyces sp. NPDC005811]|uniref:hypothetical protein n=1 Tax=Streptomyces sp. NPDC005811 TaxID=3154565 RepID=UPI0033F94048
MPTNQPRRTTASTASTSASGSQLSLPENGDRAVHILLDVYERVLQRNPGLPAGMLVMEHGRLADPEQQARAVAPGIPA